MEKFPDLLIYRQSQIISPELEAVIGSQKAFVGFINSSWQLGHLEFLPPIVVVEQNLERHQGFSLVFSPDIKGFRNLHAICRIFISEFIGDFE